MPTYRLLPIALALACAVAVPARADQSTSTTVETAQVTFSSTVHETLRDGHTHGTLTISCRSNDNTDLHDSTWMEKCNLLGRRAIDTAVKRGRIAPTDGVPFVRASALPQDTKLTAMAFTRSIPLLETPRPDPTASKKP